MMKRGCLCTAIGMQNPASKLRSGILHIHPPDRRIGRHKYGRSLLSEYKYCLLNELFSVRLYALNEVSEANKYS